MIFPPFITRGCVCPCDEDADCQSRSQPSPKQTHAAVTRSHARNTETVHEADDLQVCPNPETQYPTLCVCETSGKPIPCPADHRPPLPPRPGLTLIPYPSGSPPPLPIILPAYCPPCLAFRLYREQRGGGDTEYLAAGWVPACLPACLGMRT